MKKWIVAPLLLAATAPAFAADFSLRSECARLGGRYEAAKDIDSVSSVYGGRFDGTDTLYFRTVGSPDYYALGKSWNATAIALVIRAQERRTRVNVCIRSDGFAIGVEGVSG
jgi:hypothetical protein